jgi:hypothetical protein
LPAAGIRRRTENPATAHKPAPFASTTLRMAFPAIESARGRHTHGARRGAGTVPYRRDLVLTHGARSTPRSFSTTVTAFTTSAPTCAAARSQFAFRRVSPSK